MAVAIIKPIDASVLKDALEAHRRYLRREPNGRRANLSYLDLSNFALDGLDLSEADLTGARLFNVTARETKFDQAILYGADLRDADLRKASLVRADLRGACLRGANLAGAVMVHCDLREGRTALQDRAEGYRVLKHQMRPGELDHAILTGADLTGAQLGGLAGMAADFRDAVMVGVTLSGAKMKNARLDGADLSNSDLSGTDFSGASLRGAVVVGANLSAASLKDADLEGLLKAPPPVVFIDDRPLADLIRDHQLRCCRG